MTTIIVVLQGKDGKARRRALNFLSDDMPNVVIEGPKAFVFTGCGPHEPVFAECEFVVIDS